MLNTKEILKLLGSLHPFSHLTELEIYQIIKAGHLHQYRVNRNLYYQDDLAEQTWLVIDGVVERIKYRNDTTTMSLGSAGPGEWLCLTEVLRGGPCLYDAVTREMTTLISFSKKTAGNLLTIEHIRNVILHRLTLETYMIHGYLETVSPRDKIVRYLLARIRSFGKPDQKTVSLHITQEELAMIIGFTRETINKHLQALQEENFLTLKRGSIIINIENLK